MYRPVMIGTALLGAVAWQALAAQEADPSYSQHPFFLFDLAEHRTADVTLADVDGDGDLDVLTANGRHWAEPDFVFLNNGQGRMLEARPIGQFMSASYTVLPGDLDQDGDVDVAVVRDQLPVLTFLNDGLGNFSKAGAVPDSAGIARSGTLLDADGDGSLDLVVATRRGGDRLYRGNGQGGFGIGTDLPGEGRGSTGVTAADVDLDGDTDLVIARRDGSASALFVNDGVGGFTLRTLPGSEGDHRKVVVADLTGDGLPDIVLAATDGLHAFYEQASDGTFSQPSRFGEEGDGVMALAAGDLDGDGDVDLAAGGDGPNLLFLNDGTGRFIRRTVPDEANTYGVAIGDMNGDGTPDLVFANSGAPNAVLRSVRNRRE